MPQASVPKSLSTCSKKYIAFGDKVEDEEKNVFFFYQNFYSRDPEEVKRETEDLKTFLQQNSDKLKRKKRVFSEHRNSLQLVEKITDDINWMKDLSDVSYYILILRPSLRPNICSYQ